MTENTYLQEAREFFFWFCLSDFLCVAVTDAMHSRRQMEQSGEPVEEYEVLTPLRSVGYIVIGIAGIIIGGNFVVDSATEIALSFGLSQTFIGLSIVALGTSLPELVTSMVAAKRGKMISHWAMWLALIYLTFC